MDKAGFLSLIAETLKTISKVVFVYYRAVFILWNAIVIFDIFDGINFDDFCRKSNPISRLVSN